MTEPQIIHHQLPNGSLQVKELFRDEKTSTALIELRDQNVLIKQNVSNATYLVLSGTGKFTIDGHEIYVEPGSLINIPPLTPYRDEADPGCELVMLAINEPPFDAKTIEYLES